MKSNISYCFHCSNFFSTLTGFHRIFAREGTVYGFLHNKERWFKSASPKRSGTPEFISILFLILFTDGYQSFSVVGLPSFLASPMSSFLGGGEGEFQGVPLTSMKPCLVI